MESERLLGELAADMLSLFQPDPIQRRTQPAFKVVDCSTA
jgi:hypothetical protein